MVLSEAPRDAATMVNALIAPADLLLSEHVTAAHSNPRVRSRVFGWSGSPEQRRACAGRWRRSSVGRERCRPKVSGTEDSVRDSKVMMALSQRDFGADQAGDAGRFGENFGKILLQVRKMKIETKLIFHSRLGVGHRIGIVAPLISL